MNDSVKRGCKVASVILLAGSLVLLAQIPRENFGLTFVFFTLAFGGMLGNYLLVGEQVNFKRLLLLGILLRGCLFFIAVPRNIAPLTELVCFYSPRSHEWSDGATIRGNAI